MNKLKWINNKGLVVVLHAMVWGTLFAFPYLLTYGQQPAMYKIMQHSWIPLVSYALIFYANYAYLIEQLLFRKRWWIFITVNLMLSVGLVFTVVFIRMLFFKMDADANRPPPLPWQFFFYLEFLSVLIPLFFAIALRILSRWVKARSDQQEQETIRFQSELQHLKYQLQPHFFFNSLNNIYALVDYSPEKAKQTIHALGKLMRYFLYETNTEFVELSKEIEFMRKYIELMEIRTADRVKVYIEFPEVKKEIRIAPLLFISLIENAFKHGTSSNEVSPIFFHMQLTSDRLLFTGRNAYLPKTDADKSGSGIGINNLEKRLNLLYPENHRFETHIENEQFVTELEIRIEGMKYENGND